MTEAQKDETVLDVKNLQTVFFTNSGLFRAVDDVSFSIAAGETLAVIPFAVFAFRRTPAGPELAG